MPFGWSLDSPDTVRLAGKPQNDQLGSKTRMADKTAIEWTEATWNPVTGCSKVSPGCAHCYAETLSLRFKTSTLPWLPKNAAANVRVHEDRLSQPHRWKRPRVIFVNSMSDLFHEIIPLDFVAAVVSVIADTPRHTYQVLTKRPDVARDRLAVLAERGLELPSNLWLGVSIENARYNWRADVLRDVPAAIRFISAEPLLGSLFASSATRHALDLQGVDWLIAGGESGSRPPRPASRRSLAARTAPELAPRTMSRSSSSSGAAERRRRADLNSIGQTHQRHATTPAATRYGTILSLVPGGYVNRRRLGFGSTDSRSPSCSRGLSTSLRRCLSR